MLSDSPFARHHRVMLDGPRAVALELRAQLVALVGLTVACEGAVGHTCRDEGADCLVDTTTRGEETGSTTTGPGSTGTASEGGSTITATTTGTTTDTTGASESGNPDEAPIMVVECVPLQENGCPAVDSTCLAEIMEKRHLSFDCGCTYGHVFGQVMSGPDPAVTDACCYDVKLLFEDCQA